MKRIRKNIKRLLNDRFGSPEEVNDVFQDTLRLCDEVEGEWAQARHRQGNTILELRGKLQALEKNNASLQKEIDRLKGEIDDGK